MRDRNGNRVVFVVYDTSRRDSTDTGHHRVATFRNEANAEALAKRPGNEKLYVSCQTATRRDLALARD